MPYTLLQNLGYLIHEKKPWTGDAASSVSRPRSVRPRATRIQKSKPRPKLTCPGRRTGARVSIQSKASAPPRSPATATSRTCRLRAHHARNFTVGHRSGLRRHRLVMTFTRTGLGRSWNRQGENPYCGCGGVRAVRMLRRRTRTPYWQAERKESAGEGLDNGQTGSTGDDDAGADSGGGSEKHLCGICGLFEGKSLDRRGEEGVLTIVELGRNVLGGSRKEDTGIGRIGRSMEGNSPCVPLLQMVSTTGAHISTIVRILRFFRSTLMAVLSGSKYIPIAAIDAARNFR